MSESYWIWAIFGLVCFILEIVMGTQFFFFLLGFSAIVTAVIVLLLPNFGLLGSGIVFSTLSSLSLLFFWKGFLKNMLSPEDIDINNSLAQLHHREGEVVHRNGFRMTVLIEKNLWSAETKDKKPLKESQRVRVTGYKGMILIIEPIDKIM
jgi:membrane protein implicated in regulation of membrane protease activity